MPSTSAEGAPGLDCELLVVAQVSVAVSLPAGRLAVVVVAAAELVGLAAAPAVFVVFVRERAVSVVFVEFVVVVVAAVAAGSTSFVVSYLPATESESMGLGRAVARD